LVGGPKGAHRVWPARETLASSPRLPLFAPFLPLVALGLPWLRGKGAPHPPI
jgi:hypothetical protein